MPVNGLYTSEEIAQVRQSEGDALADQLVDYNERRLQLDNERDSLVEVREVHLFRQDLLETAIEDGQEELRSRLPSTYFIRRS